MAERCSRGDRHQFPSNRQCATVVSARRLGVNILHLSAAAWLRTWGRHSKLWVVYNIGLRILQERGISVVSVSPRIPRGGVNSPEIPRKFDEPEGLDDQNAR